MQIELTNYLVTLKEKMTWGAKQAIECDSMSALILTGDPQRIKAALGGGSAETKVQLNGEAILAGKIKAIEVFIEKITDREGKLVPFSVNWLKDLPIEDGDKLDDAVSAIRNAGNSSARAL